MTLWLPHQRLIVPRQPIGVARASLTRRSDPFFNSVVLLAPFNGADAATSALDYSKSPHTLTFNADAQIDTAISKFGGGSLLVDGTGDYVGVPDHADWQIHAGTTDPFTVEFFGYFPTWPPTGASRYMVAQYETTGNQRAWAVFYEDPGDELQFNWSTSGTDINNIAAASTNVSQATWHHIAVDFDATTLRMYVDGGIVASVAGLSAFHDSTAGLTVGSRAGGVSPINMHMEELRITKGVARYGGAFTAPSAPFPRQ